MDRDLVRVRHIDLPDFLTAVVEDGHALPFAIGERTRSRAIDGHAMHRPFGDLVLRITFIHAPPGTFGFTSNAPTSGLVTGIVANVCIPAPAPPVSPAPSFIR